MPSINHVCLKTPARLRRSVWWMIGGLACLLMGCPTSSEWDQQWEQLTTMLSRGELDEADKILHHLLPIVREKGPTHEQYGLVIFHLGEVSRLKGRKNQAEAYYWEALPLFAESVGPEHLRMADPLMALAFLYRDKNQSDMAIPLLKRALAIREKIWGFVDPQLLPTLHAYQALLLTTGHTVEAMEVTGRIGRIAEKLS